MEAVLRSLWRVLVVSVFLGLLGGSADAWTVPFPGGDVRWGPGHGGVRFPYGDVRWGHRGGIVEFPGGAVNWGPSGSGRVRINVPGFGTDIRW